MNKVTPPLPSLDHIIRAHKLCVTLNDIMMFINSSHDVDEIFKKVMEESCKALGCESARIAMREGDNWVIRYVSNLPGDHIGRHYTDEELPHAALAMTTGKPVAIDDAFHDDRTNAKMMESLGIKSVLVLPLMEKDAVTGTLMFGYHSVAVSFSDAETDYAGRMTTGITIALENTRLLDKSNKSESRLKEAEKLGKFGYFNYDVSTRKTTWSEGMFHIFGRDSALGEPTVEEFFEQYSVDPGQEAMQELVGNNEICEFDAKIIREDFACIFHFSIRSAKDFKGDIVTFFGTIQDITERKRAEETLRFSEERYRALFRDNPTMIVTLDSGLRMLSVNPSCASQLGYTIGELEGQPVLKLFHEDDRQTVAEQLLKCLQSPDQVHCWQFRKIRKDGGLLWVEEVAQAVYDLNGVLNLLVVCQDITERKQAEAEREQLLLKLEAVLENIIEGVVIFDLEGGILTMNSSAMAIHDYESIEQVRELRHQYREIFEVTDLEGRPVAFDDWPVARALRGERFADYEVHVLRKDTGKSWVCSYSGTPVQSKSGGIILAVNTMRDITNRKQAEEERERLLLQLEAVLENINEGVVICDLDSSILTMNKEALALHEFETIEQVRKPLSEYQDTFELFDLQGLPMPLEKWPMSRALHGERFVDYEVRVRNKVTGKSWVGSYSGTQVRSKSGDNILTVITIRDVSERKFAEEEIGRLNVGLTGWIAELDIANKDLEAFNYTVAHDLRLPLNVIGLSCQAIKELCGDQLPEECINYIEDTYDGVLQMNRLIDALLKFSLMGRVELHREKVLLCKLAQKVAKMLKKSGPERRVDFRIADEITADADANLMHVVLDNLLGNAWKYTGKQEKAVIEFGATDIDGKPVYFVRDNGAGFDRAAADKLFKPFQRLPGAEEFKGSGIGLATVERIIQRHGGRIWAEGEPGKGATFYFTLSAE